MVKTVQTGVEYIVGSYGNTVDFHIVFTHRDKEGKFLDGTTTEAIARLLKERIRSLDKKNPKPQNQEMILHLESVLTLMQDMITQKPKHHAHKADKEHTVC